MTEIKLNTEEQKENLLDKVGYKEDDMEADLDQLNEDMGYKDKPKLNWDQKQAIELESKNKLRKLSKELKKQGRYKQIERITKEILDEERVMENKEREIIEKEYNYKKIALQREYEEQREYEKSQQKLIKINNSPKDFFNKDKKGNIKAFVPKLLGDFIKSNITFKTIEGNDKQIYYYQYGYYKENGIALIKKYSTLCLGKYFKKYYIGEVEAYIRNTTYIKTKMVNHNWINVQNGLLNPINREFKPHTPEIFCLHQLDLLYNPESTCDEFLKQLKVKCPKKEIFETTQQMFGYCFLKDQRFEKAFLLYGDPRTFKSTLLYILTKLLGVQSVEAISLQELEQDKYLVAHLFGKLANICADLSPKELWNTGTFMKITGQDSLTAGKKFEQQLTFAPFSKLIFSCNIIPPTNNKSLAFYRRWLPLEYNIQTPKDKIDIDMREKLMKELPGILNWALDGLDKLLKQNKFSYDPTDEQIKDFYEKYSDSIQSFIFNELNTEQDDVAEKKRDVFAKYNKYCKKNKLTPENIIKFGKWFKMLTGCGEKRIGTIPAYSGVIFKDKLENRGIDKYIS